MIDEHDYGEIFVAEQIVERIFCNSIIVNEGAYTCVFFSKLLHCAPLLEVSLVCSVYSILVLDTYLPRSCYLVSFHSSFC